MLILETRVLPLNYTFLLLIKSLVRESNPHQRIKSPLHCHYANQGFSLLPHQLPLARPCYDLALIANSYIFTN